MIIKLNANPHMKIINVNIYEEQAKSQNCVYSKEMYISEALKKSTFKITETYDIYFGALYNVLNT